MYRVRNLAYDVDAPLTNKCQAGAYRAVGWTSSHTARELLIDELARELSIDPSSSGSATHCRRSRTRRRSARSTTGAATPSRCAERQS